MSNYASDNMQGGSGAEDNKGEKSQPEEGAETQPQSGEQQGGPSTEKGETQ